MLEENNQGNPFLMNKRIGDLENKKSVTEDDEALEEEKKKNLEILQSVLGSSQQTCSRTVSKAKTFRSDTHTRTCSWTTATSELEDFIFNRTEIKTNVCVCRDVSALHYDPSKEEHAAFETKTDETKKER